MLAADTYTVYAEVRAVGQLVRGGDVMELLEPMRLLGQTPPELNAFVDFMKTHADTLAASRLMIAANPVLPTLPKGIVALELPSPDAARRFVPELREFLRAVVPANTRTDGASAQASPKPSARKRARRGDVLREAPRSAPAFHIKRAGSLVIASDTRFAVQSLRPEGSQAFTQQARFQTARNHFPTDSVFIYVDIDTLDRMSKEERERQMKQYKQMSEERQAESMENTDELSAVLAPEPISPSVIEQTAVAVVNENSNENVANMNANVAADAQTNANNTNTGDGGDTEVSTEANISPVLSSLVFGSIFNTSALPSVAGAGFSLDGEAVTVRTLLINKTEPKPSLVPFLSILKPGPPLAHDAASIAPANTEMLINISLDLPLIYQTVYDTVARYEDERKRDDDGSASADAGVASKAKTTDDELAAMEKLLGFSIRDELLPALGNEVAVGVPGDWIGRPSPRAKKESTEDSPPGIMALISLRDKGKVESIVPRALKLIGLLSPNAAAADEQYKGVEIMGGSGLRLAFVGNFLVVAQDSPTMQRIIDAFASGQTLAASQEYRQSTNWQPRQTLGQIYVSGALLKQTFASTNQSGARLDDESRIILEQFANAPGAITHAVTGEGANHFHEARFPKSIIKLAVASAAAETKNAPLRSNEYSAMYALQSIVTAQATYKETKGKGNYGTLEDLVDEDLLSKSALNPNGYSIKFTGAGDKFEATATPDVYGKSGFRSFYIDASGVLRGGDKGGQQAGAADEPTDY